VGPKIDLQKHLVILSFFFPTPDPEKRENTARVKDFGGGRRQGRPRAGSYTPTTARRRRIYGLAPDSRPGAHFRVKHHKYIIEGSLEVKLPTIWTDEKQRWKESERREEWKREE